MTPPISRPNILWIMTDEQRADSLSCYGSAWAKTPALAALAARSTLMNNAFCAAPICMPSRGAQLACRYPQEIGCLGNIKDPTYPEGTLTFPEVFRAAGYQTTSFGKRNPPGHEIWEDGETNHILYPHYSGYFGLNEKYCDEDYHVVKRPGMNLILAGTYPGGEDTPSRALTDQGIAYLRARRAGTPRADDRPFLMRVSHLWPHTPTLAPPPFDATYSPGDLPVRPFDPDNLAQRSNFDKGLVGRDRMGELKREQFDRIWKDYMGLCAYIDSEIGRLLAALEETGLAENTIVVFSADHGKMLGEWGAGEKECFAPEVWRVPFLWSWPGRIPQGVVREDHCSLIDTGATLLALAGLGDHRPAQWRGRDLFGDETAPDAVFGIIHPAWYYQDDPLGARVAVRTAHWRLDVDWRLGQGRPPREALDGALYDLSADPSERRNLWNDPAFAAGTEGSAVVEDLLARLEDWLANTPVDPRLLEMAEA